MNFRNTIFLIGNLLLLIFIFSFLKTPQAQHAAFFPKTIRSIPFRHFKKACDIAGFGHASCHAQVVTDSTGKPLATTSTPSGFGSAQFHTAYNLPCTPGGLPSSLPCSTPAAFGPQTIAIVDAYNDPTVENDLNVYSQTFSLPPCTKANGCLNVVNQNGGISLPPSNSGWTLEISLDVQTAHALCQTCKILLVEANSNSLSDLGTAVNRAALMGATSISNSYGGSEFSTEANFDSTYFNHPGIAITASAGDSGYGAEYPAASKNVIAVGGTTLSIFTDNTYSSETVWSGTGSGCSTYESANSFQTILSNWNQTSCGSKRGIADVAADADPNTGAAIYDSTTYQGSSGWWIIGGTSLSSPIIASEYALSGLSNPNPLSFIYTNYNAANFHDITSGTNGNCATIMCKGSLGYDGPTGLGSPNGLLPFGVQNISPTATPTPTLILTPTATPTPTLTPTPTDIPTPTPTNTPDTTSPNVAITFPANNSLVKQFSRVTITANASDNIGVTKVQTSINNGSPVTDTTPPYSWVWNVPFGRNKVYTITAKAYDAAGNTTSTTITVTSQ